MGILKDDRFGALFSDERFEVDKEDEAFRLTQPVVSKLDKDKRKEFEQKYAVKEDEDGSDNDGDNSDLEMESEEESSDDDMEWTKQLKKEHKNIQKERNIEKVNKRLEEKEKKLMQKLQPKKPVKYTFSEVDNDKEISETKSSKVKKSKQSLEHLLTDRVDDTELVRSDTGHTMTFAPEKSKLSLKKEQENREHREERRQVRRSAKSLKKDKLPPRFWMGKRVR